MKRTTSRTGVTQSTSSVAPMKLTTSRPSVLEENQPTSSSISHQLQTDHSQHLVDPISPVQNPGRFSQNFYTFFNYDSGTYRYAREFEFDVVAAQRSTDEHLGSQPEHKPQRNLTHQKKKSLHRNHGIRIRPRNPNGH